MVRHYHKREKPVKRRSLLESPGFRQIAHLPERSASPWGAAFI
jgi:hypothetical protein